MKQVKSYIIGICGGSGSGKTKLIEDLKESFSATEVCYISQDDYYKSIDKQKKDKQGIENFDLPSALKMNTLYEHIKAVQSGETVQIDKYTFNNPDATPSKITFHPTRVIIVEGIFILQNKKIRSLLDLKIYINTNDVNKIIRRIKRDGLERGYPLDDVLYRYEHHAYPAYRKYILPHLHRADMVFQNDKNMNESTEVLKSFIKEKTKKYTRFEI